MTVGVPMMSAEETFRQMLWHNLVVRILIERKLASELHQEMTTVTTIQVFTAMADEHLNKFYPGLIYYWQDPPWSYNGIGLGRRYLRQNANDLMGDITTLLAEWQQLAPAFLQAKPLVVCEQQEDGSIAELPVVPLPVLLILARMHTAIGYEVRLANKLTADVLDKVNSSFYGRDRPKIAVHNGWTLSGMDHGIGNFVSKLFKDPVVHHDWTLQ